MAELTIKQTLTLTLTLICEGVAMALNIKGFSPERQRETPLIAHQCDCDFEAGRAECEEIEKMGF